MRRTIALTAMLALIVGVLAGGAQADQKSDNIQRLAQEPIVITEDDPKTEDVDETRYGQGTDLAFEKDRLVAGFYQGGFAVFKILNRAPYIKQESVAFCPGDQSDVSVYGDLVFQSVDRGQVKADGSASDGGCDSKSASAADFMQSKEWEGVRIFRLFKGGRTPELEASLRTSCGSHTHTLVPEGKKLYMYVSSYPLHAPYPQCSHATHQKVTIWEIDQKNPAKSKEVGQVALGPTTLGCHDVTVVPEKDVAVAACLTEAQVWNIKNPAQPEIVSRIRHTNMLFHSSGITWDGKIAVLGDEFAGAAAGAGCASPDGRLGAMWFYDVSDPSNPREVGHFGPPRTAPPETVEGLARHSCTNHNFNILPMKDPKKYVLVTSWYAAGISAVDFSDPANPKETAFYVPEYEGNQAPDTWAAYWYNGRVYTNDVSLPRATGSLPATPSAGVGVYTIDGYDSPKAVHYFRTRLNPQVQVYDFK